MDDVKHEGERGAARTSEDAEEEEEAEESSVEIKQLQGLVAELREGLQEALRELKELRHRDQGLEEKLHAHQTHVEDKIMGLKNSLNTYKEELNMALFHVKDVSIRQKDVQRRMKLMKSDRNKEIPPVSQRRRSREDELSASRDEHESEHNVIHYCSYNQRSCSPTQAVPCEPEQQRDSQTPSTHTETRRHRASLELLESERLYVSHLSLILKANISFNGSEFVTTSKDKRPFPSSLRFLIQQHLDLLHTLQERVLKCQWQGIMGDVFMRLTSKESDFLGFYLSYLKELPDCLSALGTWESDATDGESKPSLHSLLLQPVQRIPEYLLLLQVLLRQTEADHPDYYLLLVSIQQFRSFTIQHQLLLQHNQDLLLKRLAMKTNSCGSPYPCSSAFMEHSRQVKRRKQIQSHQIQIQNQNQNQNQNQSQNQSQDWEEEAEAQRDGTEWPQQMHFFSHDLKSSGLGRIPESQTPPPGLSGFPHVQPGSALADALGEFLLPVDSSGYEEEAALQEASFFDRCSSASSDSSIDIAFVQCPRGPPPRHAAAAPHGVFNNGNGFSKLSNRGCFSPEDAVIMRHNQLRPLQASQHKSKSLNGLQMESTVSSADCGPVLEHLHRVGHNKVERQSSKGSWGCPTPSHKLHGSHGNRAEAEKQSPDLHGFLCMEGGAQVWSGEPKWRGGAEEIGHTPFSEQSRKEKSGFRSSFKKLFKKKGGDEKKEKGGEKSTENPNIGDQEKNSKLLQLDSNRGTAV
ncbi:rho guanine nucleotide exchange factor 33 [Gouania willdenowi]|uniref:rho guanine nucleotide exchange factor 33 n=1 Tax=Gouania willdenowi TaxID=441366 RepID=UPI001054422F|nr:rho guanine nucleotide exchange factor 33-like [Gouania willdenowi]XP_028325320.1 rho guanine nucleotide exchange factor 33-like [Gouania willdenowi]XP_028325321.1 rho guanine nucleotide exchange factor 33-like [Gouania willdenowi]